MFFWTTNPDRLTRYLLSHSPRTYEHVSRPQPLCCVHVQLLIKDTTQPSDFICASFCKSAWGVRTLRSVLIQTSWTVYLYHRNYSALTTAISLSDVWDTDLMKMFILDSSWKNFSNSPDVVVVQLLITVVRLPQNSSVPSCSLHAE